MKRLSEPAGMEPWSRVRTLDRAPPPCSLILDSVPKEQLRRYRIPCCSKETLIANILKFVRAGGPSWNKHWPCRVVEKIKTVVKNQVLIGLFLRGMALAHQHIKSEFASRWV